MPQRVVVRASHSLAEVAAGGLGFEPDVRPRGRARVRCGAALALEPSADAVLLGALRKNTVRDDVLSQRDVTVKMRSAMRA